MKEMIETISSFLRRNIRNKLISFHFDFVLVLLDADFFTHFSIRCLIKRNSFNSYIACFANIPSAFSKKKKKTGK